MTQALTVRFSFATRADGGSPVAPDLVRAVVRPSFDEVYEETFAFVWRTVRRLGVPDSAIDDVSQEIFVTVYRRLDQFEGRCSVKTWVCSIAMAIVKNYRRSQRRKGAAQPLHSHVVDPEILAGDQADPYEGASRAQAGEILHQMLSELDEDKAAVFVLSELEGMTAPEISEIVGANINTVYSRLRAARKQFEKAVLRLQAGERRTG